MKPVRGDVRRSILASFVLLVLTACGSGEAGTLNRLGVLDFASVGAGSISGAEAVQIVNDLNAVTSPLNAGDVSFAMPTVPSADYNGVVAFDLDANSSMMGRLSVNANFVADTVTGSAGDFTIFDESGANPVPLEAISGTLPVTSGNISTVATVTSMGATLNGNLAATAGIYGVTSTLSGTFLVVKGQGVVGGTMDGTLTKPDLSTQPIAGRLIAVE